MEPFTWSLSVAATVLISTLVSVRRINQGHEGLVERLGRYHRKLVPGLNFGVLPVIDQVVVNVDTREQLLQVRVMDVLTRDNVSVQIELSIFWRIIDLYSVYYEIDDVQLALESLAVAMICAVVAEMDLDRLHSSREEINRYALAAMDEATEPWGVKVTRIELQRIEVPRSIQIALDQEQTALYAKRVKIAEAEAQRQSLIAEAEGRRLAMIQEAEGLTEVLQRLTTALPETVDPREVLQFWIRYEYAKQGKPFAPAELQEIPPAQPTTVLQITSPNSNSNSAAPESV